MYLTISKRFEFSASARLWRNDLSASENAAYFGPHRSGKYGTGHNYVASLVFSGTVDSRTGMLINVATIKERILEIIEKRFDHKFLNSDSPPFDAVPPTPENIAARLLREAQPLFAGETAKPIACHIEVPPATEATAYVDGRVERDFWIQFSAARRTCSPHLTDEENRALFGVSASPMGHGHNYRLRATIGGKFRPEHGLLVPEAEGIWAMESLRTLLDHKNLNDEVRELTGCPITTEYLSKFVLERLAARLPVSRVRLYEMDQFFAEYDTIGICSMGLASGFNASHRLHSPVLDDVQNRSVYGKCNNLAGHGHWYKVESTLSGQLDPRTGALEDLSEYSLILDEALKRWEGKHLDLETEDFRNRPSTSENIIQTLWPRLDDPLGGKLTRLRLWETANNRFTLRRFPPSNR
jgi:6-pyruvoyltetrahydropterin/6-carboxytetrahydropterin synthase